MKDLRRAAFARAYSADKNLSIFLGRPPRINHKYCRFQVLGQVTQRFPGDDNPALPWQFPREKDASFDYIIDTWWSVLCARLKEETLELAREDNNEERLRKAGFVQ